MQAFWNQATASSLLSGFDVLMKAAEFYSGAGIKKIGFGRKENIWEARERKKKELNHRVSATGRHYGQFEMCLMIQRPEPVSL